MSSAACPAKNPVISHVRALFSRWKLTLCVCSLFAGTPHQICEESALDGQASRGGEAGEKRGQGGAGGAAGVEATRRVEEDDLAVFPKAKGMGHGIVSFKLCLFFFGGIGNMIIVFCLAVERPSSTKKKYIFSFRFLFSFKHHGKRDKQHHVL